MTSLNDVLLAMSNIPVGDPIAEIWGRGLQGGGYTVIEYTGTLPITINTDGNALLDYQISGNTEQTSTPTPENPIMPIGCGERTENLANDSVSKNYTIDDTTGQPIPATSMAMKYWCMTQPINVVNGDTICLSVFNYSRTMFWKYTIDDGNENVLSRGSGLSNGDIVRIKATGFMHIAIYVYNASEAYMDDAIDSLMLTDGSTAPESYIPYGYKLPILSNSTVTNIYLGEVQTTRRIKKLVLTGEERWTKSTVYQGSFYSNFLLINGVLQGLICTHAEYTPVINSELYIYGKCAELGEDINKTLNLYLGDASWTVDNFKSYLAAQYAAGTPVTIWYVLAEPEIAVVNEPLMKIGDYADTIDSTQTTVQIPTIAGTTVIDYDGTPKPSQMYIKYLGVKND